MDPERVPALYKDILIYTWSAIVSFLKNQTTTVLSYDSSHGKITTQEDIQNGTEPILHRETEFGENIESKQTKIFWLDVDQDLSLSVA